MATKAHDSISGPCHLCQKFSARYSHAGKMQEQTYDFLCNIEGTEVSKAACICHACLKQINRNVGNPTYHPRWRPKKEKGVCAVEKCGTVMHRCTNLADPTEVASLLKVRLTAFVVGDDGIGSSVPLCRSHYNHLHSILRAPPQRCESCGSKPKEKHNLTVTARLLKNLMPT